MLRAESDDGPLIRAHERDPSLSQVDLEMTEDGAGRHGAPQPIMQSSESSHRDRRPSSVSPDSTVNCGGHPIKTKWIAIGISVAIFVILIIALAVASSKTGSSSDSSKRPSASPADVEQCMVTHRLKYNPKLKGNGRRSLCPDDSQLPVPPSYPPLLIKHATIWTADKQDSRLVDTDVLMRGSIIVTIGKNVPAPTADTIVIDAQQRILTPGLVDLHSHAGVYPWPEIWATQDGNEATNPTFPQLRAIDAFDPQDWAIPQILAAGVTTAQVMPGSANVMGGEGGLFKLRGRTVEDMYIEDAPRLLKMACGENPKRVYGRGKHVTPESRMGSAWLMRDKFDKARALLQDQLDWCTSGQNSGRAFPHDMSLESLVAILRGEAKLNVHCYKVHDLEMVIRLSKEFNFTISAFHHALEAYKIPRQLKENNISVATFSSLWGYKFEAYEASVWSPKILADSGVRLILKTDHPVIFAADLMHTAAMAHFYNLSASAALFAVTRHPAEAMGLGASIGSIQQGMDGDLVLWDRDPLTLGATPTHVVVNGVLLVNKTSTYVPRATCAPTAPCATLSTDAAACDTTVRRACYVVKGATVYTGDATPPLTNADMLVQDGLITCLKAAGSCVVPPTCTTYTLTNGVLMPGMIDAGSHVGLIEIGSETATNDGDSGGPGESGSSANLKVIDGVRLQTRHVRAAWAGGITTSIARPLGSALIAGYSGAFHICQGCGTTIQDDNLTILRAVALHLSAGELARDSGLSSTISGQIEELRELFAEAKQAMQDGTNVTGTLAAITPIFATDPAQRVPVIIEAYQADIISSLLLLQKQFGFSLVILGGAEAHLLASTLAAQNVAVLLQSRIPPSTFRLMRSRFDLTPLVTLHNAGVKVGLFVGDDDNGRNLRWEIGRAIDLGLSTVDAVRAVTSNIADMFNLPARSSAHVGRLYEGGRANFVAFDDDPFSFRGRLQLIGLGTFVECAPQQF